MSKKIGKTYTYIVTAFSLLILSYSIWIIANALKNSMDGNIDTGNFSLNLIIGILGLVLAISSLSRLRGQITLLEKENKKTQTVIECPKCKMKIMKEFTIGDYVNKEAGKCKECGNKTFITSIYQEKIKT